ncbi:unnamed protein product [Pedinophyceae sp. YPF-701]|nr:unnamed protein product [Pedinophyceae sp. YPF-701]
MADTAACAPVAARQEPAYHFAVDSDDKSQRRSREWALGVCFVGLTALVWVLSSYLVKVIVGGGVPPLVLTWIANSVFIVLLPVWWLDKATRQAVNGSSATGASGPPELEDDVTPPHSQRTEARQSAERDDDAVALLARTHAARREAASAEPYAVAAHLRASAVVCPVWFLAQLTYNNSLARTTVTSNSILSSTASLFTFLFAVAVGRDRFSPRKLAFILLAMAGTAMLTLADRRNARHDGDKERHRAHDAVIGDALVLASSLCYACYSLMMGVLLPEDRRTSVPLFLGAMGAFTLVGGAPIIAAVALANRGWAAAFTAAAVGACVFKGLVANVVSDYFWARSVLLVGPVVATVGLAVQVPLSAAADLVLGLMPIDGVKGAMMMAAGGTAVMVGFFGIAGASKPHVAAGAAVGGQTVRVFDFRSCAPPDDQEAAELQAELRMLQARTSSVSDKRSAGAGPKAVPTVELSSGYTMPLVGYGTWAKEDGDRQHGVTAGAVLSALKAGYRHIDCASYYKNEDEVGEALDAAYREGVVTRRDLFLTSKVWNDDHSAARVREGCMKTLSDLRTSYLDLYLIHWPVTGSSGPTVTPPLIETWRAMEQLVRDGLVRSIGVSNWSAQKLKHLLADSVIPPAVNQVEAHPYWKNDTLLRFCASVGVHVTAYAPLGSRDSAAFLGRRDAASLLDDPDVVRVADRLGATPGQVVLAWGIARGTSILPKSTSPARMRENLACVEAVSLLREDDVLLLSALMPQRRMVDGRFALNPRGPYRTMEQLWDEAAPTDPAPPLLEPSAALASGTRIPLVGFGTWKSKPGEVEAAVRHAIRCGVRTIDCASVYGNQHEVGTAIKECIDAGWVAREELFVVSKLWNTDHSDVAGACRKTLTQLQLSYLDAYLIHWPLTWGLPLPSEGPLVVDPPLRDTWRGMQALVGAGLVRAVGVSNFGPHKMKELLEVPGPPLSINQVEAHCFWRNDEVLEFCKQHGIHMMAYSPLGSPDSASILPRADNRSLFEDPTVVAVARKHDVTPGQVVLAWGLARGTTVVPKSVSPARIALNAASAKVPLDSDDVAALSALAPQVRRLDGEFWLSGDARGTYGSAADLWR